MVITRTGSTGSRVPPALMTTVRPARSPLRPRTAWMWPRISAGSARRPMPMRPDARRPGAGPTTTAPRSLSRFMLCWVAGWSHMWASMAGASRRGASVARAVAVRASSARPWASRARVWAVAGATASISARRAKATCSTANSDCMSNMSVTTGRWVRLRKARGVTNLAASVVRMTSTSAPCWASLLVRSRAL